MGEWRPEDQSANPYPGPPPTSPMQQPGAGQSPYPQQIGPPANPWAYPPGYPAPPGYPGYGYAPVAIVPPGERRPGTLTASAVLGYVLAGVIIFAGILLFFGASAVHDFNDQFNDSGNDFDVEFVLDGVGNLIAGGLLIAGSVSMCGRNQIGRVMYAIGAVIVIALSIYWIARWGTKYDDVHWVIVYALLFDALAVVGLALAFTGADSRWLARRQN